MFQSTAENSPQQMHYLHLSVWHLLKATVPSCCSTLSSLFISEKPIFLGEILPQQVLQTNITVY